MRKAQIYSVLAVLLVLMLTILFLPWSVSEPGIVPEESLCTEATEKAPPMALAIAVQENREQELVFSISIEDYIDSFNRYWQYDFGRTILSPYLQWRQFSCTPSIHSPHETNFFSFTQDERVYTLPVINVYVPPKGNSIQEITINFDDHSYTETGFSQFRQLCFYSLKVFFPDMADEDLQELCAEIISLGNRNLLESDQWYGPDPVPCALFHRNGVGIYPYFAAGDWEYFCIIPVTSDTIREMERKGVTIYEIE